MGSGRQKFSGVLQIVHSGPLCMRWPVLHHGAVLDPVWAAPAGWQVCSSPDLVWEQPLLTSPACQDKDWPYVPTNTFVPRGHLPSDIRERLQSCRKKKNLEISQEKRKTLLRHFSSWTDNVIQRYLNFRGRWVLLDSLLCQWEAFGCKGRIMKLSWRSQ